MALAGSFAQGTLERTFDIGAALAQTTGTGGLLPSATLAPSAALALAAPSAGALGRYVAAVAAGQELEQAPPRKFVATAEPTRHIITGDLGVMAGLRASAAFNEEG